MKSFFKLIRSDPAGDSSREGTGELIKRVATREWRRLLGTMTVQYSGLSAQYVVRRLPRDAIGSSKCGLGDAICMTPGSRTPRGDAKQHGT